MLYIIYVYICMCIHKYIIHIFRIWTGVDDAIKGFFISVT